MSSQVFNDRCVGQCDVIFKGKTSRGRVHTLHIDVIFYYDRYSAKKKLSGKTGSFRRFSSLIVCFLQSVLIYLCNTVERIGTTNALSLS